MKADFMYAKLFLSLMFLPLSVQAMVNIQRWRTPEGTQVLLVERHENPIVDVQISFKGAGSAFNPKGKNEVAEFTAALLTGGTRELSEEAFQDKINDLAAEINSSSGEEGAGITFRSLSEKATLQPAINLVNQALAQPSFDNAVFERIRKQTITGLQQQETDPNFIAGRELTRLNYNGHPYGRIAEASVENTRLVNLEDIHAFYLSRYAKDNAIVSVVGDINRQETEALVKQVLEGLPEKSVVKGNIPAVSFRPAEQKNIDFAGEQAQIMMGMPLIKRHDPDYYALVVGNYILGGGGFDSRLMKVLRDRYGYTYGAHSSLSPATEAGPLTIGLATQKNNTAPALEAARKVLADFIANGPTQEELQQAKANIIGSFPLRFDTNAKLLGYLNLIGFHDLPNNYLEAYPKAVQAVTVEDIKSAWQRRVKMNGIHTVVVGAGKEVLPAKKGQ
ncbi:M16 family metallopeptidase [Neisseria montereyensis]